MFRSTTYHALVDRRSFSFSEKSRLGFLVGELIHNRARSQYRNYFTRSSILRTVVPTMALRAGKKPSLKKHKFLFQNFLFFCTLYFYAIITVFV